MSTKKNHENKIIKKYENKTMKNRNIKKSYLSKLIKKTVCKSNIKPFEREYEKINKTIDERNKNINDTLVKLLRKKTVPKGILPNNDFYTYINYEWIKYMKVDTQKEGYIVQLDDFRLVQNKVFYELPDGNVIGVPEELRWQCAEQITHVVQLCSKALAALDLDMQAELVKNVVVSGGCSTLANFPARLRQELIAELKPELAKDLKVHADIHRKRGAWIGGSMFASLSKFSRHTLTRQEFDDRRTDLPSLVAEKMI